MNMHQTQVTQTLRDAGFDLKQAVRGMTVIGYHCTKDGVTYMCAHMGAGVYPQERVNAVINKTAPKVG